MHLTVLQPSRRKYLGSITPSTNYAPSPILSWLIFPTMVANHEIRHNLLPISIEDGTLDGCWNSYHGHAINENLLVPTQSRCAWASARSFGLGSRTWIAFISALIGCISEELQFFSAVVVEFDEKTMRSSDPSALIAGETRRWGRKSTIDQQGTPMPSVTVNYVSLVEVSVDVAVR